MKKLISVALLTVLSASVALAAVDDSLLYDKLTDPRLCNTADEFKNTYQFLIKQEDLGFTEPQAIKA